MDLNEKYLNEHEKVNVRCAHIISNRLHVIFKQHINMINRSGARQGAKDGTNVNYLGYIMSFISRL